MGQPPPRDPAPRAQRPAGRPRAERRGPDAARTTDRRHRGEDAAARAVDDDPSRGSWMAARWRPLAGAVALGAAASSRPSSSPARRQQPGPERRSITTAASLAYAPATDRPPPPRAPSCSTSPTAASPTPTTRHGSAPRRTVSALTASAGAACSPCTTACATASASATRSSRARPCRSRSTRTVPRQRGAAARLHHLVGLQVVTLVRNGRTCVLAVPAAHDAVVPYAAWPLQSSAA